MILGKLSAPELDTEEVKTPELFDIKLAFDGRTEIYSNEVEEIVVERLPLAVDPDKDVKTPEFPLTVLVVGTPMPAPLIGLDAEESTGGVPNIAVVARHC